MFCLYIERMNHYQLIEKWVQASAETRQNMMRNPNAAIVTAMVVCSSREIQVVTRLGYCSVDDLVVGVVKADMDLAVSIKVNQIVSNMQLVLVNPPLPRIPMAQIPTVAVAPDTVGWFPSAFPLREGHGIRSGDVFDAAVQASLRNFHPTVGAWVDMIVNELRNGALALLPGALPAPLTRLPTWQVPVLPPTEQDPPVNPTPADIEVKALPPSKTSLLASGGVVAPFDPNDYANYKSTTQGLLNGSVFTANMGILINLYRKYNSKETISFFTPSVVLLIISLWIEFINFLVALVLLTYYDIKKDEHQRHSRHFTFCALFLSLLSLSVNAAITSLIGEPMVITNNVTIPILDNSTFDNSTGN